MKRMSGALLAVVVMAGMIGCSTRQIVQKVRVPPRIDLKQHEVIGVVEFASTSGGELGPLVTRRFTESARRDQGLVRVVALPPDAEALSSVGREQWGPEAYRALGRKNGVRTIIAGKLTVSDVRPNIRISPGLRSGKVTAQVDATLEVQMIETASGASVWSRSASATRNVGQVSVFRGRSFEFDADDPETAYGDLVNVLVDAVTRDFHASWE